MLKEGERRGDQLERDGDHSNFITIVRDLSNAIPPLRLHSYITPNRIPPLATK